MGMNLKRKGPISEINVTPLVDVMLVLLVIFMISAPLMHSGIKLKLPKTKKVNSIRLNKDQVILSIGARGGLYIGKERIDHTVLIETVQSLLNKFKTETVFLRADYDINYGKVAKVMARLKKAGIVNIALVTEVEKKQ